MIRMLFTALPMHHRRGDFSRHVSPKVLSVGAAAIQDPCPTVQDAR
jgi:hypothetical protein